MSIISLPRVLSQGFEAKHGTKLRRMCAGMWLKQRECWKWYPWIINFQESFCAFVYIYINCLNKFYLSYQSGIISCATLNDYICYSSIVRILHLSQSRWPCILRCVSAAAGLLGLPGLNPTAGMDVRLLWFLCVVQVQGLRRTVQFSREILPSVCVRARACAHALTLWSDEIVTLDT
jgi:hypothetical protein